MAFLVERIVEMFGKICSVGLVGLMVFFCNCKKQERLPYYDTADFTPLWNVDTLKHPVHTIAAFKFTDQQGEVVTNETFAGKIYVANFFFTSCQSICPVMTNNLNVVAKQFASNNDVLFISHSVTPNIDSVSRLKQFAARYKIKSNQWHLVTGRKDAINLLARRSYFAEEEAGLSKDSTEFLHTEHCILVDRDKHIRGVYNGTLSLEMTRMAEDIKTLLSE